MIKYQLLCDSDHEFEGWFRNSADFDSQCEDGLLECPFCGAANVRKAVMAPSIGRRSNSRTDRPAFFREMAAAAERARNYVEKNFDYVGEKFPEEARKIHYGESEERGIYGEATGKEVKELTEEGVAVAPLPKPVKKTDTDAAKDASSRSDSVVDNKKLN